MISFTVMRSAMGTPAYPCGSTLAAFPVLQETTDFSNEDTKGFLNFDYKT